MFMAIIISFSGVALYFLLKPPVDLEYEQALQVEPISKPEFEVKEQRSKPTVRKLGKVLN